MADPLAGLMATPTPLTRFVDRELREPTAEDVAELGELLAATKRDANAAFLAELMKTPDFSSDCTSEDLVRERARAYARPVTCTHSHYIT